MITQLTWEAYTSVTVDFVKVLRLQKNSIMPSKKLNYALHFMFL